MFKVHYKDQSGISDIVMVSFDVFLMFLLLTLNIFYTFSVSIDDIEQENVCWYSSSCHNSGSFYLLWCIIVLKISLITLLWNSVLFIQRIICFFGGYCNICPCRNFVLDSWLHFICELSKKILQEFLYQLSVVM